MKTATNLILSLLLMAFCLKAGQAGKTLQPEKLPRSSAGRPKLRPPAREA
jgi:hypothetical protein